MSTQEQTGFVQERQAPNGQPAQNGGQPTPPNGQPQGFIFDGQPAEPSRFGPEPVDPWADHDGFNQASPDPGQQAHPQPPNGQQAEGQPEGAGQQAPNGQAALQNAPWQAQALPEHMKPEDAYGMAKYMQSEKDKAAQIARELQQQLAQYETVAPIARLVLEDPQLLQYVQMKMHGQELPQNGFGSPQNAPHPAAGQTISPAQQGLAAVPEKPQKPQKPQDYDPEDARLDPDSKSARYDRQMAQYRDDLVEWQAARLESFERQQVQARQTYEQQLLQQQQMAELQQQQAHFVQQLQYEQGMGVQEVQEFLQWANTVRRDDPALWVQAFRATRQSKPTAEQLRQQQLAQAYQQRQQGGFPNMAAPAQGQPSVTQPPSGFVFQQPNGFSAQTI